MIRQYELVELVKSYDPNADEDMLNRAYVYSMKMHGSQKRASGDPYFSHPLEVAGILTEMRLDAASIATALLHDTIEDTTATFEEVKEMFGIEVARLVDGVTKLSRIEIQSTEDKQAENFRKLVLAMSEDIRVLLIKLADRVHNMRTLHYLKKPEKRMRIATETLEIYAPLAERIGIQKFKDELQDLAFKELNPDARESILARLAYLRKDGINIIDEIITELKDTLEIEGITADCSGREKAPYSIWRKMQRKNVAFEQLSDIMAFRIMVDDIGECYHALGVIHNQYPVVPGRFKDFISTPKRNGYRSLHTTVIGPQKQRIEIQIRTRDMHNIAELGVAAHWAYKQIEDDAVEDSTQYKWMRELLEILENAQRPEEFLEHTKLELFQEQVFCFTPKGDLIELPRGATPIDFAYAVHSQVGDTCVGSKVNGRITPLTAELQNGDQVEITTSKTQTPSPTWERFVVTGKARSRIRRFIRQQQREEYGHLGRAMMQKIFRQEGYDFSDKAFRDVLRLHRMEDVEDLFAAVGAGNLTARDVFNTVFPGHQSEQLKKFKEEVQDEEGLIQKQAEKVKSKTKTGNTPIPIKGLIPGMAVHYARCCHPLPGDRIVGIVSTGKGVTIHTIDCETLESFADEPERWLDVSWEEDADTQDDLVGRLSLNVSNEPGALGTLSTVIAKNGGNINNLKITSRSMDFWDMFIDVQVKDARHLNNIVAALRATPIITSVERSRMR